MACSVFSVPGAKAVGDEMSPCVSPPPSRTDRPRCYALMREDYLWSPLQSACSMQHLRSVPSLGRQVLALRPHSHVPPPALPNTRFLNNTVPLLPPPPPHCPTRHPFPCRYPECCVSILASPGSSSPDSYHANLP